MNRRNARKIIERLKERGTATVKVHWWQIPNVIVVDLMHWDEPDVEDVPVVSLDAVDLIIRGRLVR